MRRKLKFKKPSLLLELYGKKLSQGLEKRLSPASFELQFSFRSPHIAYITGFVVFSNGWILEFDEIMKQASNKVERLKYRYHVMDKQKQLIFRYDNVAHFPHIKTHPHHKHLPQKVIESSSPDLLYVIEEMERELVRLQVKTQ